MRFELTEEQRALAGVARDLFAAESDAERLRAVWDADGERDPDLWPQLAAVGLTGVTVPEEHGGTGGGLLDLVLVAEEVGYAALPEPLLGSAAVATPLIVEGGSDEQREEWLPALASGAAVAAVAFAGEPHVLDADAADLLLVEDGDGVLACEPDDVRLRRVPSEDRSRRLFAVEEARGAPLAGDAVTAVGRARDRARVTTAAALNGVSRRLLDVAVDHARVREQFERPIGAFQAVQHLLADVHVAVVSARAPAWYGAYAIDRGLPDASVAARTAKATAADSAATANTAALQVLAGIGFTWEHDLHRWLKRGKALEAAHGGAREHHRALADHLLERGA